ncbi:unnamed protein product [Spirodela intermedia]|uniref:Uncharacterized protein n=1 Tax=Spirodela intermedia TaxID=51605 RepID=A0A7I8JR90_SPIIN|nr:unnamed protein product [Spirodela intermedia]CAA6672285.1 unnamed protein product [Spirodela intermedia]
MSALGEHESGGNRVMLGDSYISNYRQFNYQIKICKSRKNRSFILRFAQQEEALHYIYLLKPNMIL